MTFQFGDNDSINVGVVCVCHEVILSSSYVKYLTTTIAFKFLKRQRKVWYLVRNRDANVSACQLYHSVQQVTLVRTEKGPTSRE